MLKETPRPPASAGDPYATILQEMFPPSPTKSQRTRLQILEATVAALARDGVDSTNHESIARRCDVSRALVQHYFPDREELVLLAIRYVRSKFQRLCVERMLVESSPAAQLGAYVDATFEWIAKSGTHARTWLLFYYYCGIHRRHRALNTELVQQGEARIEALIARGVAAGEFARPHVGIQAASELAMRAKLLQNSLTGALLATLTEDSGDAKRAGFQRRARELCLQIAAGSAGTPSPVVSKPSGNRRASAGRARAG